ncbi:MAG: biotin carboxylase N-terminal domain-containing protein [Bacteroidales bacterium]
MDHFRKILVANRGEIAVRIIRAAAGLGIRTVAVFAETDRHSLHVTMADESCFLGDKELNDTYLNTEKIIRIARCSECDAIHPGYGFLSENQEFALACEEAGIRFIGPDSRVIALMGDKVKARGFAARSGVPVIEGFAGEDQGSLLKEARKMSLPLLVKPVAGGGGKGMRIVRKKSELPDALEAVAREAMNYFGNPAVYIEKYMENPRHIEFQIMGDRHGHVVHLYERECTIQRRYQKVLEEAPSQFMTPGLREKMAEAAIRLGVAAGYDNAGTIEFLVDESRNFYFLEMNTRIQVEHPVTEMITGVDLVKEQIRVSEGHILSFRQEDVRINGHAVEVRIYAEDPEKGFLPSPGKMTFYHEPSGDGIRIDTGMNGKTEINSYYDPLIAKLIVHGSDREQALAGLEIALEKYVIHNVRNNMSFLSGLIKHPAFLKNNISTRFLDMYREEIIDTVRRKKKGCLLHIPVFACIMYSLRKNMPSAGSDSGIWERIGYWRHIIKIPVEIDGKKAEVGIRNLRGDRYDMTFDEMHHAVRLESVHDYQVSLEVDGCVHRVWISEDTSRRAFVTFQGFDFEIRRLDFLHEEPVERLTVEPEMNGKTVRAPMNGKVVRIGVREGESVKKGHILLVMEAMKMENSLLAPGDAVVEEILVSEGDQVEGNRVLIRFAEG